MKTTLKTAEGAYSFTPFRIHEQQLDSLKSQILRVNRVNHLKYFIFKTVNVDRKDKWKGPSKPEFKRLPSPDPYYQSSSERDPNKRDWQKSTYSTKSPPEPFNLELLLLIGVPGLVLGLAWCLNNPNAWVILLILYLLPGVREVVNPIAAEALRLVYQALKSQFKPKVSDYRGPPPSWSAKESSPEQPDQWQPETAVGVRQPVSTSEESPLREASGNLLGGRDLQGGVAARPEHGWEVAKSRRAGGVGSRGDLGGDGSASRGDSRGGLRGVSRQHARVVYGGLKSRLSRPKLSRVSRAGSSVARGGGGLGGGQLLPGLWQALLRIFPFLGRWGGGY